jgi:hypothetical protein
MLNTFSRAQVQAALDYLCHGNNGGTLSKAQLMWELNIEQNGPGFGACLRPIRILLRMDVSGRHIGRLNPIPRFVLLYRSRGSRASRTITPQFSQGEFMPERRFCVNGCGNELGPMQGANSQCRVCRKRHADAEKGMKSQTVAGKRKQFGLVLLHSCVTGEWDNFNLRRCHCRKLLKKEEIGDLFHQNLIRNLAPDLRDADYWDGHGDVFLINTHKQSPRVPTLEQAHILRGVEQAWKHRGKSQLQLESEHQDLERRIKEDKLERFEEERIRWDVWDQLQNDWLKSITIEVPEAEWIVAEKAARGDLACRTLLHVEERSSAGADYNRSPALEPIAEDSEDIKSSPIDDQAPGDQDIKYDSYESLVENDDVFEDAA